MSGEIICRVIDLITLYLKSFSDLKKQTCPILWRKISASIKWFLIGREENIERPAAIHTHGLHGFHVNVIDVGSLLTIHSYANKTFVHHFRDVVIFKRL